MTTQRDENATLASSLEDQFEEILYDLNDDLEDMTTQRDENVTLASSLEDQLTNSNNQRAETATEVERLENDLTVAEETANLAALVGAATGGAVAAAIATKRARKPEVDYGSVDNSEEE